MRLKLIQHGGPFKDTEYKIVNTKLVSPMPTFREAYITGGKFGKRKYSQLIEVKNS